MTPVNLSLFVMLLCLSAMGWAVDDAPTNEAGEPVTGGTSTDAAAPLDSTTEQIPKEALPRVQPQPAQGRISDVVRFLGNYQRSDEVIKFGDDASTISGLYLPENTGKPQGGILILHDISQHAQWPQTVGPLREYLPDYGWNTLSLFFTDYLAKPLPVIPVTPPAEVATEANQETPIPTEQDALAQADTDAPASQAEDEASPIEDENFSEDTASAGIDELGDLAQNFQAQQAEPIEEPIAEIPQPDPAELFLKTMFERVEGGLQQLNTLGQFNLVVVAHGLSANWAAQTLLNRFEQNPNAKGYALIIVDAKQLDYPAFPLNDSLAKLNIPMLDIVTQHEPEQVRLSINRRNAIVREQNIDYMQITLPSVTSNLLGKENLVTRRVRGWLKTHAAGEEVDVKVRS